MLPKTFFAISLLTALTIFGSRCLQDNLTGRNDSRGPEYAGSNACINCHKNVFEAYSHNNNNKTSAIINTDSLRKKNSFPGTIFYYTDSNCLRLEEKNDSFFQSSYSGERKITSNKFDIAFGSGEKAQTYAGW